MPNDAIDVLLRANFFLDLARELNLDFSIALLEAMVQIAVGAPNVLCRVVKGRATMTM